MANWRYETHWKACLPYQEAWDLQLRLAEEVREGRLCDQILGLEHEHVVTLGKRSRLDPEVPPGPVVWVDRGGEATLHSEGQLVIYPIVKLRPRFEVRSWVEHLHEVTRRALLHWGVSTTREGNAGLWTDQGKLVFMGLRVKEGVSLHGLSINVRNDLSLFKPLKACGVKGASMDSLQKRGISVSPAEFFATWSHEFRGLACQTPES